MLLPLLTGLWREPGGGPASRMAPGHVLLHMKLALPGSPWFCLSLAGPLSPSTCWPRGLPASAVQIQRGSGACGRPTSQHAKSRVPAAAVSTLANWTFFSASFLCVRAQPRRPGAQRRLGRVGCLWRCLGVPRAGRVFSSEPGVPWWLCAVPFHRGLRVLQGGWDPRLEVTFLHTGPTAASWRRRTGADPKWADPKMRPCPSLSMLRGSPRLRQRSPGPADTNCGLPGAAGPGPPGHPPSVGHSPAGRPRSSQVHRRPLLPGCAARASSGALLHCSTLSPPASQSRLPAQAPPDPV